MARIEGRWKVPADAVEKLRSQHTTTDASTGEEELDSDFARQLKKLKARLFQEARAGTGKKQKSRRIVGDLNPISRTEEPTRKRQQSRREKHSPGVDHFLHQSTGFQHAVAESVRRSCEVEGERLAQTNKTVTETPGVVIDTNVVINALVRRPPANQAKMKRYKRFAPDRQVFSLVEEGEFVPVLVRPLMSEIERVAGKQADKSGLLLERNRRGRIDQFLSSARLVPSQATLNMGDADLIGDIDDVPVVAAARRSGAPIVSNDAHLTGRRTRELLSETGVEVMTPDEFLVEYYVGVWLRELANDHV